MIWVFATFLPGQHLENLNWELILSMWIPHGWCWYFSHSLLFVGKMVMIMMRMRMVMMLTFLWLLVANNLNSFSCWSLSLANFSSFSACNHSLQCHQAVTHFTLDLDVCTFAFFQQPLKLTKSGHFGQKKIDEVLLRKSCESNVYLKVVQLTWSFIFISP